ANMSAPATRATKNAAQVSRNISREITEKDRRVSGKPSSRRSTMKTVPKSVAAARTCRDSTNGMALTEVRIHSAGAEAWMLWMMLGKSIGTVLVSGQACKE